MSNGRNFYNQQVHGQRIISQNMTGNNSVTYEQFGQQQSIYYGQNQTIYPSATNNQQARQVQQPSISYQVAPIPQIQKQNIYQKIPKRKIHQQNQNKNFHQRFPQNVINPKNEYQNNYNQTSQQNNTLMIRI